MVIVKAKRDFIFIDEAGDPGQETDYYIQGALHLTDNALKKINVHLGAFRYFGDIRGELKSTKLDKPQKEKLMTILKFSIDQDIFIKASAVYVNKNDYRGPYLKELPGYPKNAAMFRHLIMRKLLEVHFQTIQPQSSEVELVIDRFNLSEDRERQMKNYLKMDKRHVLPAFKHIIQADSRYLELLQIADWVAGVVKEKFFTHPERDYADLLQYIKVTQIFKRK